MITQYDYLLIQAYDKTDSVRVKIGDISFKWNSLNCWNDLFKMEYRSHI